MRRIKVIFMITICIIMGAPSFVFAGSGTPTLSSVEDEVNEYLKVNYPDIQMGSAEYVDYLTKQLMFESDQVLVNHKDYENIKLYASDYLSQANNKETTVTSKNKQGQEITMLSDQEKLKPIATVKTEAKLEEATDRTLAKKMVNVPKTMAAYNGTAAAKYAKKWADSRNPLYKSHSADCTNFVSQCIVAGGKSMKKPGGVLPGGIYKTTTYWYSVRYQDWHTQNWVYNWKESSSFVNVSDLYTRAVAGGATAKNYSSLSALQKGAKIGDIVQLKNGSGKWYHSIIITGGSTGKFRYSGHSDSRNNVPVSGLKGKATAFRIIRL